MKYNCTVLFAKNISDILYHFKTTSNLTVCGACTQIQEMPSTILILRNIEELKQISCKERYIEFGSAVTLSKILELGEKRMPPVLFQAVSSTAVPLVRNVATIGGNICAKGIKRTLFAPLLALEAKLEIRNYLETKVIPISQFNEIPDGYFLTKIRVPFDEWDLQIFKRVGAAFTVDKTSASYTFLANTKKGLLSELHIAFCGLFKFRNRDLENVLIGAKLPLSDKVIENMLDEASVYFDEHAVLSDLSDEYVEEDKEILKNQFINLLKYSLEQLT